MNINTRPEILHPLIVLGLFVFAPTFASAGPGTSATVPSVPLGTGAVYYVAPSGNDSHPGTLSWPWRTIGKAAATLIAGQTVYIRHGVYKEYLVLSRSGNASNRISFVAYPGETPVIDGSGRVTNARNPQGGSPLISVKGSYVTLRGLEVQKSMKQGITMTGNYVAVDKVHSHHNYYPGVSFYMSSYGIVTNSIIHDSYDYAPGGAGGGGNADCLSSSAGSKVDPTNAGHHIFRNNLVYNCSDDGIDTWTSSYNLLENNVVHHAGYRNASNGGASAPFGQPAGNGHGFKLGGCAGGCGHNTIRNNISSNNRSSNYNDNGGVGNQYFNNQ